jgi:serine/threonine protein phosphatase 1
MFFRRQKAPALPAIPAGQRVYAVGDVHGCLTELRELLAMIERDNAARGAADTLVVMLGDLVDRGPDSAGVVEYMRTALPGFARFHFLAGNHEEAMLRSLTDGADPRETGWLRFGGREALRSYGVPEDTYEMTGRLLSDELRRFVPDTHLKFLRGFEDKLLIGDYLFVHAGIKPGRALAKQVRDDLLWIRDAFLNDERDHGHMVVHGHTIRRDAEFMSNRIGIDTGAYQTGVLTALGLEGTDQWLLQTGQPREERTEAESR